MHLFCMSICISGCASICLDIHLFCRSACFLFCQPVLQDVHLSPAHLVVCLPERISAVVWNVCTAARASGCHFACISCNLAINLAICNHICTTVCPGGWISACSAFCISACFVSCISARLVAFASVCHSVLPACSAGRASVARASGRLLA